MEWLRTGVFIGLALTLGTGLLLGVKAGRPEVWVQSFPLPVVRPLHTLGTMGLLLCGIVALREIVVRRSGGVSRVPASGLVVILIGFLVVSGVMIVLGRGSGLEYLSWPVALTVVPIAVLVLMALDTWRNLACLADLSSEGSWLLLMGLCLAPLGMTERMLSVGVVDITRALTIEWHGLDTVFAGINTALYGAAILATSEPGRGRPLRHRWLYLLAVFALLSTFGHHHYMSGQASALKWIAFTASMLGMVSFVRHVGAVWRGRGRRTGVDAASVLLRSATIWTAVAVGSGVVLAVPQVNLILHGTHAVVGHAMGAIIGVDVMIILAGLIMASGEGVDERRVRRWTLVLNLALGLMVLDLMVSGGAKGLLRVGADHHAYQPLVRGLLMPLPILGCVLSLAFFGLGTQIWRRSGSGYRTEGARDE